MTLELFARLAAIAVAVTGAHAQGPSTARERPAALGTDAFVVPIHTAEADGGVEYGLWASGRDYKVSFHDGLEFIPVLGEQAPHNLPLRWAATVVRSGELELAASPRRELRRTDWRIEFAVADGVVEAYDVLPDGVEQTFVLERNLRSPGDLRIRGTIDSPLRAEPRGPAHAPILFHDDEGRPVVEYGQALVIDAHGRSLAIDSSYDGGAIELVVPGGWLAEAAYPVVVDPLIGRVRVEGSAALGVVTDTDVDWDRVNDRCLFTYTRVVSASDRDAFARTTDGSFQNGNAIFADVTAGWSTVRVGCAYVARTQKWIVLLERSFTMPVETRIRWHLHDAADPVLSTGVTGIGTPAGETHRYADVGATGSYSGNHDLALIVFQADVTATQQNTSSSACRGFFVDTGAAGNGTPSAVFGLAPPVIGTNDCEWPAVTQATGANGDPWIVAYQHRNSSDPASSWRIRVARVSHTGVVDEPLAATFGSSDPNRRSERPRIAGNSGRYMLTYLERDGGFVTNIGGVAPRLRAQRFDWDAAAASPVAIADETIADEPSDLIRNGEISYDRYSRSHWAVVYERSSSDSVIALRLGHRAGIAEQIVVHDGRGSDGFASSIAWMEGQDRPFAVAWGSDESGSPLWADNFHSRDAQTIAYGTVCGSGNAAGIGEPHAGSEQYGIQLVGATPNTAAAVLLGLGQAAIPLTPIGMTGCVLNVDPNLLLLSDGAPTDGTGEAIWWMPLPAPLHVDLFAQWAYLAPGLNPLGVAATNGIEIRVR